MQSRPSHPILSIKLLTWHLWIYMFVPGAGDGLSQYIHYFRPDYTTEGMHLGMDRKRECEKSCRRVETATEGDKQ